jgi:ABC-type polysaccharide/polyol phosphate export permease
MSTTAAVAGRRRFPRELLWNLTLRELRGKYKRSILGYGWSLINPLVFLGIYSFVFSVLFKTEPPVGDPSGLHIYAFFLVCGLLPWTFHSNCINGSIFALSGNGNLIRKVYFPRWMLPGSNVASWLITYAIELLILTIALLVAGGSPVKFLPLVVLVVAIQTVFSFGIGLFASALNVFFRDIEYLTGIFLQIWFWATPIIWPPSLLLKPDAPTVFGIALIDIIKWNPMYEFVEAYRDLLYDNRLPELSRWLYMLAWAAVSIVVGGYVFKKMSPRMAEEL